MTQATSAARVERGVAAADGKARRWACGCLPVWASVLPLLMLDTMVQMGVASVLPGMQQKQLGSDMLLIVGATTSVRGTLAFFLTPLVGALSDRFGRRWLIIAASIVACAPYVLLYFTLNIWVFQVAYAASGVLYAVTPLSFSMVADVAAAARDRARGIAVMTSTVSAGIVLGPALSDYLEKHGGSTAILRAMAIASAAGVIWGLVCIPESLPEGERKPITLKAISPLRGLRTLAETKVLRLLAAVVLCSNISESAVIVLVLPYFKSRFDWDQPKLALFIMMIGIVMVVSQGLVLPLLLRCVSKLTLLRVALVANFAHVTAYGIISDSWMIYATIPIGALTFLAWPVTGAIVSEVTSDHDQAAMQGTMSGLRSLTNAVSPLFFGMLLHATVESKTLPMRWHGVAFFLGSFFVAIATALTLRLGGLLSEAQVHKARLVGASPAPTRRRGTGKPNDASGVDEGNSLLVVAN